MKDKLKKTKTKLNATETLKLKQCLQLSLLRIILQAIVCYTADNKEIIIDKKYEELVHVLKEASDAKDK